MPLDKTTDDGAARATLLVTVKGDQTVAFIDEASGETLAAPVVGDPAARPHEIILSADGARAFVTLYGDKGYPDSVLANRIAVLDVAGQTLERVIDTNLYTGPHGLARDAAGRIWATVEGNECLIAIDPETMEIARSVYVEQRCHFIATCRAGRYIYTAHKELPFIGVVDTDDLTRFEKIPLEIGSQAIWHAPDKDILYVADFCRRLFHVVDTASRQTLRSVELLGVPGWPYATPDGRHVVVSSYIEEEDRGFIEAFDTDSFTRISSVELPAEPFHVLDGGDGRSVLTVVGDGRLVRIDIATGVLVDGGEYPLSAHMPEQVVRTHRALSQ